MRGSQAFFEGAKTFAEPLTELRQFLGAEDEQGNGQDDQQVLWGEQAFKHNLCGQNRRFIIRDKLLLGRLPVSNGNRNVRSYDWLHATRDTERH